jgi:rhodanese-related sulfurtransferase
LVARLKEKGIENAFALVGGTNAWKNAGYPMEGETGKQ